MRLYIFVTILALLFGCGRDQSVGAANAMVALQKARVEPLTHDQVILLDAAMIELQAIQASLELSAMPTVSPQQEPGQIFYGCKEHAQSMRSIPEQEASGIWNWVLGSAGALLGVTGIGGLGMLLAKRATGPLLTGILEFGTAAIERLKQESPDAAKEVIKDQVIEQEKTGIRTRIQDLTRVQDLKIACARAKKRDPGACPSDIRATSAGKV